MLKLNAPEKALKMLKRAITIAEVEDKYHDLMTFYDGAITLAPLYDLLSTVFYPDLSQNLAMKIARLCSFRSLSQFAR